MDLGIESGLESADGSEYRYDLRSDGMLIRQSKPFKETCISLSEMSEVAWDQEGLLELRIHTKRNIDTKWMNPVKVYLRVDEASRELVLIGVRH